MNKITVNELLGIVTKPYNYHTDKRVSSQHIGESLIKSEKPDNMMDITKTCYIQLSLNLGRTGYQLLKAALQDHGRKMGDCPVKLQAWKKLREYQSSITPKVRHDTEMSGVKFHYSEALELTIKPILSINHESENVRKITVYLKDGVDGSGGHVIYQQVQNEQTHNLILFMFCILRIVESDTGRGQYNFLIYVNL